MSSEHSSAPPEGHEVLLAFRDVGEAVDLYSQVAADRLGLARVDLTVLSSLEASGPKTAGQLAEATGLTSGAVTGIADRLERAGYVRREPDPDDRRRVIITLLPDRLGPVTRLHEPLHQALHALEVGLPDQDRALLASYMRRAAAAFQGEAVKLRGEAPSTPAPTAAGEQEASAPLAGATRGRLEFSSSAARVQLRAGAPAGALFHARFEGKPPKIRIADGTVSLSYSRLGPFGWRKLGATVALSAEVPWEIALRGGVARLEADLTGLTVAGIELRGGGHSVAMALPRPQGTVTVRLTGGASDVSFRRPAGTEARLRVTGGAASLVFDSQRLGAVGGTVLLESAGYAQARDRYDFEFTGGAAGLAVVAG